MTGLDKVGTATTYVSAKPRVGGAAFNGEPDHGWRSSSVLLLSSTATRGIRWPTNNP